MEVTIFGKTISLQLEGDRAILLLCMSVAAIFWFFTKMSNEYTTTRHVDVDYLLPKEQAFSELPTNGLIVELKGTGWNLMYDYFFASKPIITVDLREEKTRYLEQSSLLNRIADSKFELQGLTINKTVPSFLYLNYEPRISKKVPIELRQKISLAKGHFMTGPIQFSTDSIVISGARSVLDTINFWPTEWLILEDAERTIQQMVKLSDYLSKRVYLDINHIEITVPIEEFTQNNVIAPITMKNAPDSLRFFPENVQIFFSLPLSQSGSINRSNFQVEADLNNVTVGGESSDLPIIITERPQGIRSVKYTPKSIRFWFVENDTINRQDSLLISSE